MPPSLKVRLPEKHMAYFASEVVDELDLTGNNANEPTSTFSM